MSQKFMSLPAKPGGSAYWTPRKQVYYTNIPSSLFPKTGILRDYKHFYSYYRQAKLHRQSLHPSSRRLGYVSMIHLH